MLATAPTAPIATAGDVTPGVTVHRRVRDRGLVTCAWFGVAMWALYVAVGWWLIEVKHFLINDAMSKTLTAQLMVLSRDPHLASMGYYWMPLPMLLRIPVVLVLAPFHQVVMAGPIVSGLMAAATLPVIYRIGRTVNAPTAAIVVVVVAYGLSPVTVVSAASGMAETTFGLFAALSILGYVRWIRSGGSTNLAFFAVAYAGAVLSRYESLLFLPIIAVVFSAASPRGRRLPTVVLAVLPGLAAMGLFTLASWLIKRDPIFWWHAAKVPTTTPRDASWLPTDRTAGAMIAYLIVMLLVMAPAAFPVLAGALTDRCRFWASLGLAGFVLVQPIAVTYQVTQGQSWATPRLFMFMAPLFAACAALWLLRDGDSEVYGELRGRRGHPALRVASRRFGWIAVALVPVGALSATVYLADPAHSAPEGEYVLFAPLLGRTGVDDVAQDSPSNPVFTLNVDQLEQMMDDLDPELAAGKVVAMDSVMGFPLLFTEHPKQFLVPEDRDFERIVADPRGRFDYVIILPFNQGFGQRLLEQVLSESSGWPEGRFEVWREYSVGTVYRFVPAGGATG